MEEAAMMDDELRQKNAFLREKVKQISHRHPELRDLSDGIALEQGTHVEVGTPFLERVNGKLQERARAIIERRPNWNAFSKTDRQSSPGLFRQRGPQRARLDDKDPAGGQFDLPAETSLRRVRLRRCARHLP
jgi:hypothetical protein